MTKHEAIVLSAFTGVLMGNFGDLHEYIEKILGRPVMTHELASKEVMEEIKEKARPAFIQIMENIEG